MNSEYCVGCNGSAIVPVAQLAIASTVLAGFPNSFTQIRSETGC